MNRRDFADGIPVLDLLAQATQIFTSKGEAKKMLQANGVSLNKNKLTDIGISISSAHFISNAFLVVQKGKKNFFLVKCV